MPPTLPAKPLWLLLLALSLGACAAISENERMTGLDNTLKNYERAIRWADFDAAYGFHRWGDGDDPTPPKRLGNVRVTQYQLVNSHMATDNLSYTQTVRISYYLLDSPRERQIIDRQRWEYDEKAGRWWLASPPPQF